MTAGDDVQVVAAAMTTAEKLQGAAAVAQIIVAVVALFFAYRAARAPRDSIFLQQTLSSLMSINAKAQEVRSLYLSLFAAFPNAAAKSEAQGKWLEAREGVSAALYDLCELLPEIRPVREAWLEVEREEDTHVRTAALRISDTKALTDATNRYKETHSKFVGAAGKTMKGLR